MINAEEILFSKETYNKDYSTVSISDALEAMEEYSMLVNLEEASEFLDEQRKESNTQKKNIADNLKKIMDTEEIIKDTIKACFDEINTFNSEDPELDILAIQLLKYNLR